MKKIKCYFVIIISILFCCSCTSIFSYKGDFPELFTVAINSILETKGFIKSEIQHQPVLKILEEDEHGRKLFCYSEAYESGSVNLVISQKVEESYVYFYPDYNFISDSRAEDNHITIYGSKKQADINNPKNNFSEDDILQLKNKNDWSKQLDLEKCIKADIVQKKQDGPLKYEQMKTLCEKIVSNNNQSESQRDVQFFTTDTYGRSIYILYGNHIENFEDRFVAVLLFNADGSYNEDICVMELTNKYNYQDNLKQFKELNNWNNIVGS